MELDLDGPPRREIPIKYDEQLALKARTRRNRRLGGLILNEANKGFFKVDRGLWIPTSKGEISCAIDTPMLTMNKSKHTIYEKTHHKGYAKKAFHEARKRMEKYYIEASKDRWLLSKGLLRNPAREYTEQSISHSKIVIVALAKYVQDLNSFIERDWPQDRWRRYRQNYDRAEEQVKSLESEDLLNLYDEAVWSTRSRMRYWHTRGMNPYEPPEVPHIPFNTEPPVEEEEYEQPNS